MQTWTDEALRALLCEELEAASYPVRRKQLIERSAARLGERVESRADLRPGSAVVRGKSRLGMLLTELIHSGVISEDAVGYLHWLHKAISNLKAFLLGTYHGRCTQLQAYLDEFCFRFNRRKTGDQIFMRLARAVAASCAQLH